MPDPGLFAPDSVAWRLHADPAMLVAAMRALVIQALEPRAMAGVDQHSKYREDPWGRLQRTTAFIYETTYGDAATAERAIARVRGVHRGVRGTDPTTGRGYSADDPDLLLWIHAVEVHSVLAGYRSYAGRVSDEDADRYVGEMAQVAELLGVPAGDVPRTLGEVRDLLHGVEGLQVTEAARAGLRTIFSPPMPFALRPLWLVPTTATVAILPRFVRRMYGLPWIEPASLPVRVNVFALTRAMNLLVPVPPIVRQARERAAA